MMQIGTLDQQIIFQTKVDQNKFGALKEVWTDQSPCWAKVISQKGGEAFESARTHAHETVRVLLRFRDDITASMRFKWDGVPFNILYVDKSNRRAGELWLTAESIG